MLTKLKHNKKRLELLERTGVDIGPYKPPSSSTPKPPPKKKTKKGNKPSY